MYLIIVLLCLQKAINFKVEINMWMSLRVCMCICMCTQVKRSRNTPIQFFGQPTFKLMPLREVSVLCSKNWEHWKVIKTRIIHWFCTYANLLVIMPAIKILWYLAIVIRPWTFWPVVQWVLNHVQALDSIPSTPPNHQKLNFILTWSYLQREYINAGCWDFG